MRVLVVGGTGFIGGAVVRRLAAGGHDVAVFHRGGRSAVLPAGVEVLLGDRTRIAEHAGRLRAWKPEVVVDTIAFTGADARGVLETFRGTAGRLVVLSSLDVYRAYDRLTRAQPGPPDVTPLGEDAPLREIPYPRRRWASGPDDPAWGYDKLPVERAVLGDPELPGTVLRLPAVYGPGDHLRHRVGRYVARMDSGGATLDLDAGFARWRWTRGYVDDVAEAIVLACVEGRASGRVYNVGETSPPTEGDWVRAIARAAGYAGAIVERARGELPEEVARELEGRDFAQDVVLDTGRLREELGWRPRVPVEEGLEASVAWERGVK